MKGGDFVESEEYYIAHFDGSSKPNPGMMNVGGYIQAPNGEVVKMISESAGYGTNNKAEYIALIRLLEEAVKLKIENISVYGDSQLVVNQVNNKWRTNGEMMHYKKQVMRLIPKFKSCSISHVRRKKNTIADSLSRM